jgi:hypothetical protein
VVSENLISNRNRIRGAVPTHKFRETEKERRSDSRLKLKDNRYKTNDIRGQGEAGGEGGRRRRSKMKISRKRRRRRRRRDRRRASEEWGWQARIESRGSAQGKK